MHCCRVTFPNAPCGHGARTGPHDVAIALMLFACCMVRLARYPRVLYTTSGPDVKLFPAAAPCAHAPPRLPLP